MKNIDNSTQGVLLNLVRCGIGVQTRFHFPEKIDWTGVYELSQEHGVAAIALDGINKQFDKDSTVAKKPPLEILYDWIGLANQMEVTYARHEKNMRELNRWYRQHDISMMVLKGYGLSLNYPIPNHRPCGDIDIYLFGEQEKADKLLQEELGIKVDKSHHHHTVFNFQEETVENHYDFFNVHVRKSNIPIEKKLKEIAHRTSKNSKDSDNNQELENDRISSITNTDLTDETNVFFPSVEFNAIYLLRHCAAHFASTRMNIRQVLDWGFFMEKHHQDIDWNTYLPYLKQVGMFRFYNLMGLFCMRYLGFDASIFHGVYSDDLDERFAQEILSPEFKDSENGKLLWSLWVKPRRWWHNRWKNRICYPDGAWSEFAYGLWAKILKPSHFIQ